MIENVIGIKWAMETIEQNWNFTVGIDTLNVRRSSSLSGEVVAVYGNGEVINYVATPTKMNSYLSVGLIPIFTDAVGDFNEKINLKEYELKISGNINIEKAMQKVLEFENNTNINPENYYNIVENIFDNYYNDDKYIKLIV